MGQFGDCKTIVICKIKEFNDWESTESDLELIFECFEVFMDYYSLLIFLQGILPNVIEIGRDVATDYIKKKIDFYERFMMTP